VFIVDFNGTMEGYPFACWAEWEEKDGVVCFGGDWFDIPDMPATTEPDDKSVWEWANKHENKEVRHAQRT